MNIKEEYRSLVIIVKSKLMKMGKPHRMQDIATELGYSRPYFSKLLGDNGSPSSDHISHLKETFPFIKDDVKTSIVSEPGPDRYDTKPHPDHVKYVRLLEDNIEFLKGVMTSNLGNISVSQQHLRALAIAQLNQLAKMRAREEGKTVAKVMAEINKEVADAALSIEQKDILAGILGKGEKA